MYFSWIPIWFFSPHNSIHTTKGLCLIVLYLLNVFSQYGRVIWQRRHWQPILVLLPGNCYGWRSLVGCSPWGHEESDMTEKLHFHFSLSCIGEGNGNPLQCSCLENSRDGVAWWAAIYGVAQSWTRLMWLSSSSSRVIWTYRFEITNSIWDSNRSWTPNTEPGPGGGGLVAKSCLTLATPWTVACQAPLSMGFSRQGYGVGCHFLLQGIFLIQKSNQGLLHCFRFFIDWAMREAWA